MYQPCQKPKSEYSNSYTIPISGGRARQFVGVRGSTKHRARPNLGDDMQKILVVDDDANLVELLGLSFEEAGYSIVSAANGTEALKQARSCRPDLIVLDVLLPDLDGFTVCETLRKDRATASIPILMLTGLASEFNRLVGLESGADDYVTKPVSIKEILSRSNALLHRSPT